EIGRRCESRHQPLDLGFVAGLATAVVLLVDALRAQRAVGQVLAALYLDEVAVPQPGRAEVLERGGGIVDHQAADAEPARDRVERRHLAGDFDLDLPGTCLLDARRTRLTRRGGKAVYFDALAHRNARQRALRDGVVVGSVVVDADDLARDRERASRGVDRLDRALDQAVLFECLRARAALVV